MMALVVTPRVADSLRIVDLPRPTLETTSESRGVLVRVLQVGIGAADRRLIRGTLGSAPQWSDYLVVGHENVGVVEEVADKVKEFEPGDTVVGIVRLPGTSFYDRIGASDFSSDPESFERGLNLMHGFCTELYEDKPEFLIKVPSALKEVALLIGPLSVVEKGIEQAYIVQKRLGVWHPSRAAVLGVGPAGLLTALSLRMRGFDVCTFARTPPPNDRSDRIHTLGGCYHTIVEKELKSAALDHGPFDLIFDATGTSELFPAALELLASNGVLVLASVSEQERPLTGAQSKAPVSTPVGNRVILGSVSASRLHYELAIATMTRALVYWPGWLDGLMTNPVVGFEGAQEAFHLSVIDSRVVKTYIDLSRSV